MDDYNKKCIIMVVTEKSSSKMAPIHRYSGNNIFIDL